MQTERFSKLRKSELEKIFEKKNIIEIWRKIVRNQLRNIDLKDLFDHYDFNFNIDERATTIRSDILSGNFKVSQALTYRIEKKFGVCRHLVTPQPTDALVFQVLVESVSKGILENQPSKNAFYSRDKHSVSKPHEVDEYMFNWRQQWKKMQKMIYNFNDEQDFIIVTDLSNYYDSIDIKELRKVFTSYSKMNEVLIDLVFKIIEEISWKPDYLPYSSRGLPTTNIEGVRLLAHSFLFEIDEVIKQETNNSFARWMDDITIGVNSKKQAVEIISSISDMLKSRGLALNLSKTNIYDEKQGYYHFQIEENRYLDSIENVKYGDSNYKEVCKEVYKKFKKHFKDQGAKYWEKVTKRYITAFGRLESKKLLDDLPNIYAEYPNLRINLNIYLSILGYGNATSAKILEIIKSIDIFDDISMYQLCFLITQWEIPTNEEAKKFLKEFEAHITKFSFTRKVASDFYCLLWFKAKYNHPEDLLKFITKYKNLWQTETFLRRQVTAIISRLLTTNEKSGEALLASQISSGVPNTVTLASQILTFRDLEKLESKMLLYLFPTVIQRPYPLPKFLVLCSVLNSEKIRIDSSVKEKIISYIKDPYYLKWLDLQYNIN
ncbi:RNA-directed DNA polymerase [Paenibacillus sp. N3/727]|uniref:RNA-directed DNA polymerase n=1 Tax=Paenibacillus sp. N3/727 TaxID=2925845 RepID=UPI001F52C835|nr:RNA-directed DNA polymerase [Paenibacillus sp. N3/727]UNK20801.1 RNA-directed DNA polymerase [Paenibacillus sp. N3/727]